MINIVGNLSMILKYINYDYTSLNVEFITVSRLYLLFKKRNFSFPQKYVSRGLL